ncbi:MAG: 50S ribosomal protein L10 [Chloroflexi bacterium]|nr:50S ribosomal protein L10 [Chloroflexota bacterium]
MPISKERKRELVAQYEAWLNDSEAIILAEYSGLDMHSIDKLRADMREVGGEFHIIKNTLAKLAFSGAGFEAPEEFFVGSTAIGIAYDDPPGVAKAIADLEKDTDFVKIKGGFMGKELMTADEIKVMAELPPLPVVRGQLLGTIMAPASQLTRVLAEPGRSLARVLKAYSESDTSAAAAA